MDNKKTICLNMIVKNESHIIRKTLENLCGYFNFTYWVICDTGSTDNTVDIILKFFSKKNIEGEICNHEWKNFGYNRTLAIEAAFDKTDYLLIFDADDSIVGNFKCPQLTEDSYNLFFGTNNLKYVRPLLINNRQKWKFKGILHEFLVSLENSKPSKTIEGDYFVLSGREGSRNKNTNKYLNDANLLKSRIELFETSSEEFEDRDLLARYTFYCANSFKDCDDIYNAILYYKKVFDLDTWNQEKYMSALYIGDLYEKLNNNEDALLYWYKAITYDKERREAVSKIMNHYYISKNWFALNCLHENIKNFEIKDISSKLFLNTSVLNDNHYFNSIACANISEWMSGYYSCKFLILNDLHLEITFQNFQCYAYNIHLDTDNRSFLEKLLILFKRYYKSKKEIVLNLWKISSHNFEKIFNLTTIDQVISIDENSVLCTQYKIKDASNKILIYTGYMETLWNSSTLNSKSLGGSEKAVIYLSRCFPKNFDIYISGDIIEEHVDNIKYIPREKLQALLDKEKFHTIIVSRYISFFEEYLNWKCFQLVLYAHDVSFHSYPLKYNEDKLRDVIEMTDYVLCLTEWHKNILIQQYGFIKDANIKIINNGINLSSFDTKELNDTTKIKNKFVWSSCSNRGLNILLELWPKILEKLPTATLDICSYSYFPANDKDSDMKKIIDRFDSITHHGKLNTQRLYNLMKSSEFWVYTNTFPETSCITAMEMLMSEVICLYYPNAGLSETIGNYGIKVKRGNEIEEIINLNPTKKEKIRKKGKEYALTCSWERRAQEWSTLLKFNQKKKEWIFFYNFYTDLQMIEKYIDNLKYIYPDYNISLSNDSIETLLKTNPEKFTITRVGFDDNSFEKHPNTEIGFLNLEPLNIPIRLKHVLEILNKYANINIKYYDYSKSNISIISGHIKVKNPIHLPYVCSPDEIKSLIGYGNCSKEFDFGIIHSMNNYYSKTSNITPPRRNKVVKFLIKSGFKINLISGWGDDRDTELGKCKIILNIHGQLTDNEYPQKEEISTIFEHIRCNRLLEARYTILSEENYNLDRDFIKKYSNLKIINYEDFFNIDIINSVLYENTILNEID